MSCGSARCLGALAAFSITRGLAGPGQETKRAGHKTGAAISGRQAVLASRSRRTSAYRSRVGSRQRGRSIMTRIRAVRQGRRRRRLRSLLERDPTPIPAIKRAGSSRPHPTTSRNRLGSLPSLNKQQRPVTGTRSGGDAAPAQMVSRASLSPRKINARSTAGRSCGIRARQRIAASTTLWMVGNGDIRPPARTRTRAPIVRRSGMRSVSKRKVVGRIQKSREGPGAVKTDRLVAP